MNLEKRIRRHVIGSRLDCFAVTAPGCEHVCRRQLRDLSERIAVTDIVKGGVVFSGRLTDIYMANLHLRTAGRILMRLATFRATAFRQLEKKAAAVAWALYLPSGAVPHIHVTAHRSRLRHTDAIAQRIDAAIRQYWRKIPIPLAAACNQQLHVRLLNDRVTISLDSSGDNLYQRGIKTHGADAPLRETAAAFILERAGYRAEQTLLDPMCGSGTFSLEGALIAKGIAPGFFRSFAFEQWPAFRRRQWAYLKKKASETIRSLPDPCIHASDHNPEICRKLADCVHASRLGDAIDVRCDDFFRIAPPPTGSAPGLIVLNPPYGKRLGTGEGTTTFYREIETKLKTDFRSWRFALLVPSQRIVRRLNLRATPSAIPHGGLRITLLTGIL